MYDRIEDGTLVESFLESHAVFTSKYEHASKLLWGENNGLRYYSNYMGDDCRGTITVSTNCYRISQSIITVANHKAWLEILNDLDPEKNFWGEFNFGSWATPYEAIMIAFDAPYMKDIEELLEGLDGYPVLQLAEDKYEYELEYEASSYLWAECMSVEERVNFIKEQNDRVGDWNPVSIFAARRDELPYIEDYDYINPDHTI